MYASLSMKIDTSKNVSSDVEQEFLKKRVEKKSFLTNMTCHGGEGESEQDGGKIRSEWHTVSAWMSSQNCNLADETSSASVFFWK